MRYTDHYSLKKPQPAEQALVKNLNDNADAIDLLIYQDRRMTAKAYDSQRVEPYVVGERCIYENRYYKCVTQTSGNWDSSAWDETNVGDDILEAMQSGGTEVIPNPTGTAVGTLTSLGIDGDKYEIQGGGGGSSTLAGLDDVGITTLSDGQLLVYDDTNDEWVNGNIAGVNVQPVIYSTEEREIGVWTDGKPLYQKMLIFTAPSSSSYTQQPLGIPGYDSIIIDYSTTFAKTATASTTLGMYGNGTVYNDSFIGLLNVQANTLDYKIGSSYYGATIYLTLLYTKTTDTPGAGTWTPSGVPAVHYSTDEQVVGTWIDGSTLYERTYSIASVPKSTSYSFENDASDIIPHSFNGVYTDDATRQIPNLVSSNPIVAYKYNNKLTIQNSSNNILTNVEITVRYTKTTS